jgi:hypothetical protein
MVNSRSISLDHLLKKKHDRTQLEKIKRIKDQLNDLKKLKKKHYKKFKTLRKTTTLSKITINLLNGITVSSVIITFSAFPPAIIVSLVASSLSTLGSIALTTADIDNKFRQSQTTYLQLEDLYNHFNNQLLKNDPDLDKILDELNARSGLILDSSSPVSVSDSV